jgi:hypothetical protein
MGKSILFLNYLAFFILFITGFVFIFQANASILGYAMVFVTNTIFMFYMATVIVPDISNKDYFVAIIARCAIMVTTILHFTCLIFVLMMIYKLHVKFSRAEGLPLNIPEPHKTNLYNFNVLMITTFCICTLLISIILFKPDKLDINMYELLKNLNFFMFYKNLTLFFTFALSISTIVISSLQVRTANSLAVLSRQQLNLPEYNSFKKKKFSLDNIKLSNKVLALQNSVGDAFL